LELLYSGFMKLTTVTEPDNLDCAQKKPQNQKVMGLIKAIGVQVRKGWIKDRVCRTYSVYNSLYITAEKHFGGGEIVKSAVRVRECPQKKPSGEGFITAK